LTDDRRSLTFGDHIYSRATERTLHAGFTFLSNSHFGALKQDLVDLLARALEDAKNARSSDEWVEVDKALRRGYSRAAGPCRKTNRREAKGEQPPSRLVDGAFV
jgi:hypothetical protein